MSTWAHKGIVVTLENAGPRMKGPEYYRAEWVDPNTGDKHWGCGFDEQAALKMFYRRLRKSPVVIDHSTWWKRIWHRKIRITW